MAQTLPDISADRGRPHLALPDRAAPSPKTTFRSQLLRSLRARLLLLWTLSLIACLAVAALLTQLYRQSTEAQVGRAEAVAAHACELIRDRYRFYTAGWHSPAPALDDESLRHDLTGTVTLALARQDGVEGGLWQAEAGSLAYAYPTYEGSGPKNDLPAAERDRIRAVNEQSVRDEQAVGQQTQSRSETLVLHACPLTGPIPRLTGWAMMRVYDAPGYASLALGLAVLLALMFAMSAWLMRLVMLWTRHVRAIETGLAGQAEDTIPVLALTGERELDQIIEAPNEAGARLAVARKRGDALASQVAAGERLAALGRVAAGVAHEIRNPIAAMRLRAESALAADDTRRQKALSDILELIARLDTLVTELLAMTQQRDIHRAEVALEPYLQAQTVLHRDSPAARGITIMTESAVGEAVIDPEMVGRILDNLLSNALQHTPPGGKVTVSVTREGDGIRIAVADTGLGIPADVRKRIFEPFVTSRADGTGLGLAIARELADAHGGRLVLLDAGGTVPGHGAIFVLDLPGAIR